MQAASQEPRTERAGGLLRRRKYLIDPAFQTKYVATTALLVFFMSTVMFSVLYYVLHQQARARLFDPAQPSSSGIPVIFLGGVVFSLVMAAGVGFWSVFLTHRICGPLVLIRRWLVELAEGRLSTNVRPLRRNDEFKDFFAVFGRTVEAVAEREKRRLAALSMAVDLAAQAADADAGARARALESIKTQLETLRQEAAGALGQQADADVLSAPRQSLPQTPASR